MILVIGNFGNGDVQYNGQTGRTNTIYDGLKKYSSEEIKKLDTSIDTVVSTNTLRMIFNARKIVILPGMRAILPLLFFLACLRKLRITSFIVIGGWLPEYIKSKKLMVGLCKRVQAVFVQTQSMVQALNELGLTNAKWLPNFRLYEQDHNIVIDREKSGPVKLVYYARVDETKGIELLIKAFNIINRENNILLDVYGPIKKGYEEQFQLLIGKCGNIKYKGILKKNVLETLGTYELLVFPTHYDGEGFPGTILEAILAGVPIVASDWKYNSELISYYKVGELHDPFSDMELATKIKNIISDEDKLREYRCNCATAKKMLAGETIMKKLIEDMG